MTCYGYISTYRKVAGIPADENTLRYSLRSAEYIPVIENTTDHIVHIADPGSVIDLYPSYEKSSYGNTRRPQAVDYHYNLMIKLAMNLEKESLMMFPCISDLSEQAEDAVRLYHVFQDKEINLEFLDQPWLNSSNFIASFRTSSIAAWDAVDSVIRETIMNDQKKVNDLTQLSQVDRKTKKNRQKR